MKNLENNKLAASVLVAGLIAMVAGKITDVLYTPEASVEKRGYQVEVVASSEAGIDKKDAAPEPIAIGELLAIASLEKGQKLFKKCATCHTVNKGGAHKVGPALYNVVGAKAAADNGFAYSAALKEKQISWGYEELFAFLKKPKKYVPGTKMSFAGFKKDADIAAVILYLRENGDSKQALPAADFTATIE
jgi:cytochrome c